MPHNLLLLGVALIAGVGLNAFAADDAAPATDTRVFEMRTYITHPGRLDALNARFRNHTTKLFEKHGMTNVGYWVPRDEKDGKSTTLVYILAYPSLDAREKSWKAFQADPQWQEAKAASEKDGPIVKEVKSVFLDPTDYSPVK